jgi:hypothetical protein
MNFPRILVSTASLLVLVGCKGGSDLMPLEVGREWKYIVEASTDFKAYVTPMKVTRQMSVANAKGFEVVTDLGVSRLAWVGDGLMADRIAGTQFSPPVPLLFATDETFERKWKGEVTFIDRASPARATQSQKADDELEFEGKKIHCIRSTIRLETTARKIELITWFSSGLGIVQQEQRTDEKLLVKIKLLEAKAK